jgi:superfamily II DNA or RNA helicase
MSRTFAPPESGSGPETDSQDTFAGHFSSATYARGRAYARELRAELQHVVARTGGVRLIGRVLGSAGRMYHTELWLDSDGDNRLYPADSSCSCPVGFDCKHAVALLLTFMQQVDIESPAAIVGATASHGSGGASAELRSWLDLLDETAPPAPANAGELEYRLVFLLHTGPRPELSLGKSRILKKGGLGKPAQFLVQDYDLAPRTRRDFIGEDDETPLRLFKALTAGSYGQQNGPVQLAGETGALLLVQAARTGRLYDPQQMEEPLHLGDTRPLKLKWELDAGARQRLSYDLEPGIMPIPVWPPYYYDSDIGTVGPLQSDLPAPLLRKLLRAPALGEADAMLARARLDALARTHQVTLPLPVTVQPDEAPAEPLATVTLTMGRFRNEMVFSLHEDYPIAMLHFDYPCGTRVSGSEHPEPLTRVSGKHGEGLMRRNLGFELATWHQLQGIGLESLRRRMPRHIRIDDESDCLLASPSDARGWMPLLTEGLQRLEAAGIVIEYAADFPFRITEPDDWFVAVDESSGIDWFDLDLGVLVNGERVSLVPSLLRMMREQPQILAKLATHADDDLIPVAIDTRRIVPMRAARLRAWLTPLLEFLDDERPRLSRYHAAVLAALDEQPAHWLGGETLRELGRRLRDFSGLTETPPAANFGTTLRPYQQAGLNWLQFLSQYHLAGILADDMGLGKTVQTLAHLQLEKHAGRADRPCLVVAPTSLLPNWAHEAAQFTPDLKVLTLHGPDRAANFGEIDNADIVLTTYPLMVRDQEVLLTREYHVLVLDEAQFIKNPKAQSHRVSRKLNARHRLSLTGTPLENHLGELWAQFDFLIPGLLGNTRRFGEVFRTPIEKHGDEAARASLAARIAPFMLRRTKEQVLRELPPRTEIIRWVELSGAQRDLYESLRVAFDRKLREVLATQGVGRSQIMILDALLKLRQVCCDPRLVKLGTAQALGKKGIAESAKLAELMTLVIELLDEGRTILLFSQFTSMLALIEEELARHAIRYAKLTGQTRDRDTPVRDFQEGRVPLFLISLKAGGTGLNLTAADTVIHYDPWWNPAVEAQATARAHRIGQDKPVFVYKLLGQGTVEEKILELQSRKLGLADQLVQGSRTETGAHLITPADLEVLFQPLVGAAAK